MELLVEDPNKIDYFYLLIKVKGEPFYRCSYWYEGDGNKVPKTYETRQDAVDDIEFFKQEIESEFDSARAREFYARNDYRKHTYPKEPISLEYEEILIIHMAPKF